MSHDPGVLEAAVRNLSWMTGNLYLAWTGVWFATIALAGRHPRGARVATALLVAGGVLVAAGSMTLRGGMVDHPLRSIATVTVLATLGLLWAWRARRGDRWARSLAVVGALAFAPNAPYVLTDVFHHMQDVRLADARWPGSILFSVQYGWFLVLGAATWVVLLDLVRDAARGSLGRRQSTLALVVASIVAAFGIYLGRIERFHSWHPIRDPGRFLGEVSDSFQHPGPVTFVVAWSFAVALVGAGGLALVDRWRESTARARDLLLPMGWAATGVLLVASPLVPLAYRSVGVDGVASPRPVDAAACVLLGLSVAVPALVRVIRPRARDVRIVRHARPPRRGLAAQVSIAILLVPLLAAAASTVSAVQWWAQFRGLCEHGPHVTLHRDRC